VSRADINACAPADRIEVRQAVHVGAPVEAAEIRLYRLHLVKHVLHGAGELGDVRIPAGPPFVVNADAQAVYQVVGGADAEDEVALVESRAATGGHAEVHAALAERSGHAHIRSSRRRCCQREAGCRQRFCVHDLIFA
jgi:hypothetical protein